MDKLVTPDPGLMFWTIVTFLVLVALIQAYIFTLLTALFVGMAVHPH